MAKAPAAKNAKGQAAKGKPRKKGVPLTFWVVAVPLVLITLPTWIFLFFAMLPTLVAFIVERGKYRFAWLTVGGINIAGAAPFLLKMWFGQHSIEAAARMLTDVYALIVILGSAAFGWALYLSLPPVVGTLLQLSSQRRIQVLQTTQRRLVEEWGRDITNENKSSAS